MALYKSVLAVLIPVLVSLPPASWAQGATPDEIPEDELIVRLRPYPGAPRPAEVVDAVNQGRTVPGGLGIGNPHRAEFLLPARLEGRMAEFYDENPDLPRARLERTVTIHYPTPQAAHGILTALGQNPNVEFVEVNSRLYLPTLPQEKPVEPPPAEDLESPGAPTLRECPPAVGVIPNDPLFAPPADCDPTKYQWGSYAMRLPEAWQYVRGHAKVLVIDLGLQTDHPDLKPFGVAGLYEDWFIGGNFRPHLSYNYALRRCDVGDWGELYAVHGTHTAGILAAAPNNGEGVAGVCWYCPLAMGSFNGGETMTAAAQAITEGADKGVQVGSMSFGKPDQCPGSSAPNTALCEALDNIKNRDIAYTASSGNDLAEVELPANDDDVVAVGALATDGTHWDRRNRPEGCPYSPSLLECGSNYSLEAEKRTLDLVAPGQFVLSTVFTALGYGGPDPPDPTSDRGCGDQFPYDGDSGNDGDSYGSCSGTSMSSPYVAGVLALLRTANPLLTWWQLYQVLTETASLAGAWDQKLGYGLPDAVAAVQRVQGTVAGQVLINRATPMLRLYSVIHDAHLFTTSPQAAVAEIEGAGNGEFNSDPAASPIGGYPLLPGDTNPEARSSFWLFTGPVAPDGSGQALIPLYRLTRDRKQLRFCGDGTSETKRAWAYTTSEAEIRTFHTASMFNDGVRYFPEGIEGYLYPPSATPPVGAEKLFRYYDDVRDDWLLLLESEQAPPGYDDSISSSGGAPNGEWLGWVLPNLDSDSDWVIDAWELLLGTDPQDADSDDDGCSDGDEILGYGHPYLSELSDPLDGVCVLQLRLFADDFESGDLSAWDGSVP